jgi:hypothetical protein
MSAIIKNYELGFKDGADPSTSTATTAMSASAFSEIIPLERSFMGEIHVFFSAGRTGTFYMQYSNDEGSADDEGVARINSQNLITNWVTHSSSTIGSTDDVCRITMSDIGARWGRLYWAHTGGSTGGVISSARVNVKGY